MLDLGDTLREARVRRGLTIKNVEDDLKIRSKYLQALEQDDFEVIPGTTFVRAFMRSYVTYLGLDADRLMEEYLSQYEPRAREQSVRLIRTSHARGRERGRRRQPNYVLVGVVAVVVIMILAFAFRSRVEKPAVLDPLGISTTTNSAASEPSADVTTPAQGTAITPPPHAGTTLGEGTTTTGAPAAGDGALALVIRASGNRCFLTVREESPTGKTLFSGTLEKGDELSYSYAGQYYLNIGAPSAVQLLVDGRPVEVPEPYGQFVLSKAGLERL